MAVIVAGPNTERNTMTRRIIGEESQDRRLTAVGLFMGHFDGN
jgi:hypothetical protein